MKGTVRDEWHRSATRRLVLHGLIATLEKTTDTRCDVTNGNAFMPGVLATR
jgi:hypothetical protein